MKLHKSYDFGKGEKLTAIFVHGIATDSSSFNGLFEYIKEESSETVRCVAFDLLGVGKSPKDDSLNYGIDEQMEALASSIKDLKITTPIVMIGHSMGTFLVERYVKMHEALRAVLISPPVYRPEDFENPVFRKGLETFKETIAMTNREMAESKVFKNEMEYIIENPHNYKYLAEIAVPTTIIYGEFDRIIAAFNIPGVLKANPLITAVRTSGGHGVTKEKFGKIWRAINGAA